MPTGLANVSVSQANSTIGTILPNQDNISGLVFYANTLPFGMSTSNNMKEIFSVGDAEAIGIVGDYSDETKATATVLITAIGSNGDSIALKIAEWKNAINLGTYIKVSTDTTTANVAVSIAAIINAGTVTHGYSASVTGSTITITARAGVGVYLNAASKLTSVITGAITVTITDFSGGVASVFAPIHYHIAEAFRQNPGLDLFIGLFPVQSTHTFSEITTLQNFASGNIRQCGVYYQEAFTSADILSAQAIFAALATANTSLVITLSGDVSTLTIATLTDLSLSASQGVNPNIGQDGNGLGNDLFRSTKKSIAAVGAEIGTTSLASVGQCIGEVGAFNVASSELDVIAFSTGELYSAQTAAALTALENKKYTFLRKVQPGYSGSFWNFDYTCINTGDYGTKSRNRTFQKAARNVRTVLLQKVNSRIILNADGTLSPATIAIYIQLGQPQLDAIVNAGDLSAAKMVIDPRQNVLQTSIINVQLRLLPVGIAKYIVINIGFVPKIV